MRAVTELRRLGLLLAILMVSGCSEATRIYSDPPGATVWINNSALGETPVKFRARSWSVRPNVFRYRVEKDGYVPREGYLNPRLSVRRIVSAYLSSCMTCFRGFYEFDPEKNILFSEAEEEAITRYRNGEPMPAYDGSRRPKLRRITSGHRLEPPMPSTTACR